MAVQQIEVELLRPWRRSRDTQREEQDHAMRQVARVQSQAYSDGNAHTGIWRNSFPARDADFMTLLDCEFVKSCSAASATLARCKIVIYVENIWYININAN